MHDLAVLNASGNDERRQTDIRNRRSSFVWGSSLENGLPQLAADHCLSTEGNDPGSFANIAWKERCACKHRA